MALYGSLLAPSRQSPQHNQTELQQPPPQQARRSPFKAQPTRYFLHGFVVRANTVELWVFDRSGAYSSEKFHLGQTPELLVQTLSAYAGMSDVEAGFNSFVKHCKANDASYVEFGQGRRFHLRPGFVAAPSYVVGPGTPCLAASRGASAAVEPDTVVKFSWRDDAATHAELRLLELARERNVKGVVRILGSLDLVSISELRHGLQFQPFASRTLSCVVTAPLGRPFQKFQSIPELLDVMGDLVEDSGRSIWMAESYTATWPSRTWSSLRSQAQTAPRVC